MKNTKLLIKTVLLFILLPVLLCVGTILAKYAESTLLLVLVLASYVLPACVAYPLFSDAIGKQKIPWIISVVFFICYYFLISFKTVAAPAVTAPAIRIFLASFIPSLTDEGECV